MVRQERHKGPSRKSLTRSSCAVKAPKAFVSRSNHYAQNDCAKQIKDPRSTSFHAPRKSSRLLHMAMERSMPRRLIWSTHLGDLSEATA